MPLTLTEWLIASAVLIVGAVVQGSVGFGVALLGAPVLFLLNPLLVPGPMIIAGFTLPLLILIRDWRGLEPALLPWAVPGQAAGAIAAAGLLAVLNANALAFVFGLLVVLAVVMSSLGWTPDPTRGRLAAAAAVSGFMATATSIGGPPLALLYQRASGTYLRATLSAIFLPGGFIALAALAWAGRFGVVEMLLGLMLLPAVIVGFWLSGAVARYLNEGWLRTAVLAVSGAAGIGAMIRAIVGIYVEF